MCLFGWLPKTTHPPGGPRRRWRVIAKKYLKVVEDTWYNKTLNRQEWHQLSRLPKNAMCCKQFRRDCDKECHKCSLERRPVRDQERAVRCDCIRWLRRRGGLAVHRCDKEEVVEEQDSSSNKITKASTGTTRMQSR